MTRPVLLDTCALIWLASGATLRREAEVALEPLGPEQVLVSPITSWEIGQLVAKGRLRLAHDPLSWLQAALGNDLTLSPMPPGVLVAASFLPGAGLRDPADRILAATTRAYGYRLMTRDRPLLDYAAEGHMQAIAC